MAPLLDQGMHNKQWAEKMKSLGLMPSHTGLTGGKKTGQKMKHYPIPDGLFLKILSKRPEKMRLPLKSTELIDGVSYILMVCPLRKMGKRH